jgi:ferredoxin
MRRKRVVAVVGCRGGSRAVHTTESCERQGDCKQMLEEHPQGILECAWGCVGLGSCVTACRLKAININVYGTAEVDREKCVGCGLCVRACPKALIRLAPPEYTIQPLCANRDKGAAAQKVCGVSCIGCRICEKNCPADAITIVDSHAVINENRCISCGMCAVKCPRGVIVDMNGVFTIDRQGA